jgi:hypothetical protein
MNIPTDSLTHSDFKTFLGMTLRDYFASAAMQGYMGYSKATMSLDEVAIWSYKVADALLKARQL